MTLIRLFIYSWLKIQVPSSSGLGHRPLTPGTRVRPPLGSPRNRQSLEDEALFLEGQDVPLFKRDNPGSNPGGITTNDHKGLREIVNPFCCPCFSFSNPISNLKALFKGFADGRHQFFPQKNLEPFLKHHILDFTVIDFKRNADALYFPSMLE